ncbi:ATP-binding cassette domain-containing protein [Actinospica durhamensis]|uniref:ATP-binding cassette domain-containing protein n=1 Tax=Actinospica durhamensis TaxID=1508375 RepID=A0A941EKW3_9ACTN|nr:ATP-binding cassette domain-containing protein [Actinospica durhamensis]MBR7832233.1 ATP-binding cassette domain-containing protein [Actinospica durhamensis]
MSGPPVALARELSKSFGRTRALDGCTLEIPAEGIVGLLGQNGAGKTTLMRVLAGLVRPDAGSATVCGHRPGTTAAARRIGVTIEGPAFYPWLNARRNLLAAHRSWGRDLDRGAIESALRRTGIEEIAGRRAGTYSQGQRQRLALAVAIAHEPDLLILDEPGNGLDPDGIADLRALLLAERERGATVLISSHLLAELEGFCDTVVMMHRGRVLGSRPVRQPDHERSFVVELASADVGAAAAAFERSGHRVSGGGGTRLHVEIDSGQAVVRVLSTAGIAPESVAPRRESLEAFYFASLKEAGE